MFRSYLIATIRTLLKNRGLTAINILGLAIGMASVILIILYIQYEFSYDRHHAHANRIYGVFRVMSMENTTSVNPRASGALALTESMARKFFRNQNPIGKALQVDHQELSGTYFVTGIVRDFPPNSTFILIA